MLLLDYNEDLSLHVSLNNDLTESLSNDIISFDTATESIQGSLAKVQINTLSPYVGFGGGSYQMTSVKRVTAKDEFLKMSSKDRNCEVELYEDCRTRKLVDKCKCIPWKVPGLKVGI